VRLPGCLSGHEVGETTHRNRFRARQIAERYERENAQQLRGGYGRMHVAKVESSVVV
jgi:hypothetical protein